MKKGTLIVMSALFAVIGCKKETLEVVVVNDEDAQEVWFEDLASNVKVVPLISEEPIGSIRSLLCNGNEVMALDNDKATLYYFDNGVLISKMNHLGRGRGEYLEIKRFTYSPLRKELYVTSGKDILRYSVPRMQYVGTIEVDGLINYLSIHDENNFFVAINIGTKSYTALIDINTGKVTKKIEEITPYASEESDYSMSCYSMQNHYYAIEDNINTIVALDKHNEIRTLLKYNFGDKSIPAKYLNYDRGDFEKLAEYFQYMMDNGSTRLQGNQLIRVENDDISFWYYYSVQPAIKYYYRYNTNTNTSTNLKGFRIKGINRPVIPTALSDSGYVTLFEGDPGWYKTDEEPSSLATTILEKMKNQELNNPVLIYYEMESN